MLVMAVIYGALWVSVAGVFVYTGVRGLSGHDIALPTKSGSLRYATGKYARFGGALSLALGMLMVYLLLSWIL